MTGVDEKVCKEKHKNIDNEINEHNLALKEIKQEIKKLEKKITYFGFGLVVFSKVEISSIFPLIVNVAYALMGK